MKLTDLDELSYNFVSFHRAWSWPDVNEAVNIMKPKLKADWNGFPQVGKYDIGLEHQPPSFESSFEAK